MQQIIEQFQEQIRRATPLRLRGGGTKDWYGQALQGEVLDTRAYAGIVDYEPTELVITARCGTPLVEIEALLAGRGQMLAFEPPAFGAAPPSAARSRRACPARAAPAAARCATSCWAQS
jgi:glycolate oxidase FAD binding subunit